MGNYIFSYGPKGRGILVDDDGRLLTTNDAGATGYVFCYGDTGRAICVDSSGRLLVSQAGGITGASNIGDGSGLYAGVVSNVLIFKSIIAGSGIFIAGGPSGLTIHNTYEDDVQDLRDNFDNASGVWDTNIATAQSTADGVRTDFDNASGVWTAALTPSYKETIATDSWIHDGSGLYYYDVNHNLNTKDIIFGLYDTANDEDILADTIRRTTVNIARVYVSASGLVIRVLCKSI